VPVYRAPFPAASCSSASVVEEIKNGVFAIKQIAS
jgi:hypothetical protein